jgi:deoxyribonuclease V
MDDDRFGAVDVHYPATGGARVALVVASDPRFATIVAERVAWLDTVLPYQPGRFYARELPAITAVLGGLPAPRRLIIDGYCDLDPLGRPGLGTHVHRELRIPVVGVAKTAFHTATHAVQVRRGSAAKPLYVTAAGLDVDEAVRLVTAMSGRYRLPDALRLVDALARGHVVPRSA